jgi:acyl carrier protein
MSGVIEQSVDRVQTIIVELLANDEVDLDENLIDSGLLDSFGLIELLSAIEEEFEIQLPLEDLDLNVLRSVRSIASWVDSLRAQ